MKNLIATKPMLYDGLLLQGERFWDQHINQTLFEIENCLDIMDKANYLPECFWEEIQSIHATNYSSIYNLTKRMIEANYFMCCTKIKPSKQFLQWVYDELVKAGRAKANLV